MCCGVFLSLHNMKAFDFSVFNVSLNIKRVRLKVIPIAAGKPLRLELLDNFGADILNYGGFQLCSVICVVGNEKKLKRISKRSKLFKISHTAQQPFVVRCVRTV